MSATLLSGALAGPDVLVVDGVIAETAETAEPAERAAPAPESVDVSGCLVTPGLVNAHHHLLQSAFRTLPGTRDVPMARWLQVMATAYRDYDVDPDLTHKAASVGLAESLLCGVTTVADHHLTWPAGVDPVEMALATARAADDLGARLCFVRGTAGDSPDAAADSVRAIHRAFSASGASGAYGEGRLQLAVGPSGVHADGPETFAALAEVARDLGLRRRTQANEQVDVAVAAQKYGRRPLELLAEWGWLEPGVTVAHLCDVTADEIAAVIASGAAVTHAPGCDVPMGWGVAPVAELLAGGVDVGLGTSGGGSNDGGHLLADARLAVQVSGLVGAPVTASDAVTMATAGSAAGLGRPELGTLVPGTPADLCVWDMGDVADAGVHDPQGGLIWASPGRRPRDVMVAGRWVVRDGVLLTADSRGLATELTDTLTRRRTP
ncbi:MAG: amidohydrolase family protein [Corynebacterium sp.]|uniref:amidohydrolase family protein n=1 Tax=Corynebacterium sp. TaxID=1720 RepID=UPI003F91F85D